MTASREKGRYARALAIALALASAGCGGMPIRVSSELGWARAERVAAPDADELTVVPGEMVRLESQTPLRVVTLTRTPQGETEVARTLAPEDGIILVRVPLGVTALRVPLNTMAHVGAPREPEMSWFDLETASLAWARSPLGTPFPALAAAARIDGPEIAEIDAVLAESRRGARDVSRADDAILAVRSVVALRAVRALQGVRAYPYARNVDVSLPGPARTRDIEERTFMEVPAGGTVSLPIEGPTSLAVWSRVVRGTADVVAEVRVSERGRLRGASRANVLRVASDENVAARIAATTAAGRDGVDPTLAALRRVFVHVPPGRHTYDVTVSGAPGWIAATDSSAYVRVEDAFSGAKNERHFLARATQACDGSVAPLSVAVCAVALALSGDDDGPRFDHAMAAAPPAARRVAAKLGAGAPADRAADLESDAATSNNAALAIAARDAAASVDLPLRDAWSRGTLRGTSWETVDDGSDPTWFTFLPREAAAAMCPAAPAGAAAVPITSEREVDAQPQGVFTVPWRRVRVVRLLAVAPCKPGEPIEIEVDGQPLTIQPGAERAIWHVVVRGETARVRRLDHGAGHVYALSDDACGGHGTLVHRASPLGEARTLSIPPGVSAPGVEVWLKEGSAAQSFTIASQDGVAQLDVTARVTAAALVAIDEQGARWRRVGTVGLPEGFANGVRAAGPASVAVRLVARGVKGALDANSTEHAQPPNVAAVVAASREILAATTTAARSAAALRRALLLASYGAERAALEDAELAKASAPTAAEDPTVVVRRAILPPAPIPLDSTMAAYGIESDFDPNAARCTAAGDGPRARMAALDKALRQRSKSASFDRNLAVQAATLATLAPQDPRASTLVTLATTGSKWRLLKKVEGGGGRVPRPHEKDANPLVDAEGHLRARLLAGDPFGERFASVSPERPAKAFLADLGNARARLDIVCVPRRLPAPDERCPLKVRVGESPVAAIVGADGRATIELPLGRGRGKGAELEVSIASSKSDHVALVRIVLDAQLPGTTQVEGVGWVLDVPHIQYRFLLPPGRPIRLRPAGAGLLRIDAIPEPGVAAEIVITGGGREIVIPTNGEPKVIPVPAAGEFVVTTRSGPATVAIAERIDVESRGIDGDSDGRGAAVRQVDVTSARVDVSNGAWRDVATASPRPLSWLEDSLGTIESHTGGLAGTIREGASADTALDAYGFEGLTYRRRIESINLFTLAGGLVRVRDGAPTYGGTVSLYEDLALLRLRVSGTAGGFAQNVGTERAYALRTRAFVEYSWHPSPDFFILPRLGYDGYYTSLASPPASSKNVDDDIYNGFRFSRSTFAFLQGLFWYVPFFNDIFYLRLRGTYDATNGAFSHASARPGTFLIFRTIELAANADFQYFERTTGARSTSGIDTTASAGISIHLPVVNGSFEVRPNTMGTLRADGRWQVLAGIALIGSYRRGARDYSSLELAYPEETSGGVPWRTESRGQ